jgi:DNA-binding response OmpR family regulator
MSVVCPHVKRAQSRLDTDDERLVRKEKGMVRNALPTVLPTVVVADPDTVYQDHIIFTLRKSFRCIRARSLREAYQAILYEHPSLLILELNQPDGNGISLIEYLQTEPTLRDILIACVTQRATIGDKLRAFRAGADEYIIKPLTESFYGQILLLQREGHMART